MAVSVVVLEDLDSSSQGGTSRSQMTELTLDNSQVRERQSNFRVLGTPRSLFDRERSLGEASRAHKIGARPPVLSESDEKSRQPVGCTHTGGKLRCGGDVREQPLTCRPLFVFPRPERES